MNNKIRPFTNYLINCLFKHLEKIIFSFNKSVLAVTHMSIS